MNVTVKLWLVVCIVRTKNDGYRPFICVPDIIQFRWHFDCLGPAHECRTVEES